MSYECERRTAVCAVRLTVEDNSLSLQTAEGVAVPLPNYQGPYEVTPTTEEQVLSTANKTTTRNIVVNPIPSNYGLITWDGTILTVS